VSSGDSRMPYAPAARWSDASCSLSVSSSRPPSGSLLLDQSLETAHQLGITQAGYPTRKAGLPKRIAEPGEWTPLVFKGLPNSNADESQSLESIDPMNLIVDWMAESADLERTHPIPTIADACWHPIETVTRRLVSRFTRMRRAIIFPRATFRFITFSGQLRPRSNDWPLSGPQPRTRGEDEPVAGRAAPTACLGNVSSANVPFMTLKARVCAGRLVVDEPTDLPEGTEVELLPLDPGDWLDEADRAALHAAFRDSDADVAAGCLVDAAAILKELRSS